MKFLVPNYSCLQNQCLGGYRPQIPVLSVLCPELNLLNPPPPEQNSWVRHCPWLERSFIICMFHCSTEANESRIIIWAGLTACMGRCKKSEQNFGRER